MRILASAAVGGAGGALFWLGGLPLPWILGSALAVMVAGAVKPGSIVWPRWLGEAGIVVVAYLLGRSMTRQTAITIAHDLPWMILAALLWVGVCLVVGRLFAKGARIGEGTAMLGCVPGGLTQMVVIADHFKGTDPGAVAIIQTARLIIVLYTVPVLATWIALSPDAAMQTAATATAPLSAASPSDMPAYAAWLLLPLVPAAAWLLRRWRLPAGEFIGPMLVVGGLSIAGCPWPALPGPLLAAAQVSIGLYIGNRVQLRMMWTNKRLGPLALLTACLLVAATAAAAWLLAQLTGGSVVTWFLALAPGGLGEVAVTALVVGADVSQVTAFQLSRLFIVLLAAPPILRLLLARRGAAESGPI
ncbi:AbrB family transcriptional regulator [Paenibacillus sabuli]|nr:AbrB family transcriptional regulator [Paenibacillus sabuli]